MYYSLRAAIQTIIRVLQTSQVMLKLERSPITGPSCRLIAERKIKEDVVTTSNAFLRASSPSIKWKYEPINEQI